MDINNNKIITTGHCLGENCPGKFDLNVSKEYVYQLLNNRIKLFNTPTHSSSDEINNFEKE